MTWRTARSCDITAAIILLLCAAFRLWYGAAHELVSDEAYYWQWSRHLDYGYYDNTPLLAYVIHFFVQLFGDTELGVRAGAVSCVLGMSAFVYLIARRLFSPQIGLISVAILNIVPLAADASFLMTCDPPQLLLWAMTVYVVKVAIDSEGACATRLWLIGGVLAGLTIMAKLNGLIILPAVFLYLLLSPQSRHWLKRPEPYIAAVIAIAILTPFLYWNHIHENAYWQHGHQMSQRGRDKPNFPIRGFGDFLGAQAILISPLFYLTYLRLMPKWRDTASGEKGDAWLYLWCCSAPVTFITACVSLHNKVEGNWAVAAYVTGIIMIAVAMAHSWKRMGMRVWHITGIVLSLTISTAAFIMPWLIGTLHVKADAKIDRSTEMVGWKSMASRVADERESLGGAAKCFVFGFNYRLPSQAAFYLPDKPITYSLALHARANNYMFWEDVNKRIGDNAVFINDSETTEGLDECRAIFDKVEVAKPIDIYQAPYAKPIRTIQVFRCHGFKGYDRKRWQDGW
ncbi:MAG TPA: glycosyltransferase family 39 protein [Capsulimonadaceae bacterium]|jgi:4-amino-4-deoxy-L-arabinose transferase-like glycosyltransferase